MMSEEGHSFSAEKKAKARIGGTDRVRGKNCELKGSSQNKSKQKKNLSGQIALGYYRLKNKSWNYARETDHRPFTFYPV